MTLSERAHRLSTSSLRKQFNLALGTIVGVLLLTALSSAASVIAASVVFSGHAEEIVALQDANRRVLQEMAGIETGLLSYGLSRDRARLRPYLQAQARLPEQQQRLRELAEDDETLLDALDRQDEAIAAWFSEYDERRRALGRFPGQRSGEVFGVGSLQFEKFGDANTAVQSRIDLLAQENRRDSRSVMLLSLLAAGLFPAVGLFAVSRIGRRLNESVVAPLTEVTAVLERLRRGDIEARAEPAGAQEVREIAAGLNSLTEENLRAGAVEADVLSRLESIDKVRTDLVSTVSHELRTPLTSIKGYLELLQGQLGEHLNGQQVSMLGVIHRNIDRLNELISNLLALSQADETPIAVEPLDLRAVASEVATDIRITAANHDVSVRTLQSATPVVVLGDRSQLIRAVQNLATNAVKFSRPGGAVELRVVQEDSEAVLEVVDEGIGIPARDLAGLGSRFYRASNAMRAEIAGTGLGLRIVQTILHRHNGALGVESVEGEGSTFTIRLPLRTGVRDVPEEARD